MDRLIDFFTDYLRYERNYSVYTVVSYTKDLEQFGVFVHEKTGDPFELDAIDSDLVREWIIFLLDNHISSASVNRKLSSLKSFFKFLIRQGLVQTNPLRLVNGPKIKKALPHFIRENEMNLLLDGDGFDVDFAGVRNRLIFEILYDTGIRRSELVGIKNADIDYESSQLKVTGKRNKQRLIPFAETLKERMLAYVKIRNREIGTNNECFFVRKNGEPLSTGMVYIIVKKNLSEISTLSKCSPHVLRHSFATSMLNNGAELNAVKELLGHNSLASTSVYTHTTFKELKKVYHAHPRAKLKKEVFMNIRIQSIHFDATAKLEAFVQKKVSKLGQYFDGILLSEIVLKVIKPETTQNKHASVKLKIKNGELFAEKISDTFEGAIDECCEALSKQLLKFKEKAAPKKKPESIKKNSDIFGV